MSASDPLVDVPVRDLVREWSALDLVVELRTFATLGEKVAYLAQLATRGASRWRVASLARTLGSVPRAHRYVRDRIRYEDEPVEMLETPSYTIATGAGDCEAQAVALAALVAALGYSSQLVPMGGTPDDAAHLAILISRAPQALPRVVAAAWQPFGLEAPEGYRWAETTVRAELGEVPIAAALRLGERRADLGRG